MIDVELKAKGVNGQITVTHELITIERKGFGRLGHSKGERRIPISQVTAVQVRPAGPIANGFIRFTVPGSPDRRGGLHNASSDENAVIFHRRHREDFDAIRDHVESLMGRPAPAPAQDGPIQQIEALARLRDQGILSEDEFEAKKSQLLEQI